MPDKVRVLRVYEFSGDRAAVEEQIRNSLQGQKTTAVHSRDSTHKYLGECTIRVGTIGDYPEIISDDAKLEGEK